MRELKNHPSPDQLDSYDKYPRYYENDLELVYTPQQSIFTLWAPSADNVRLNLYSSGEAGVPVEQMEMDIADNGTWCIHRVTHIHILPSFEFATIDDRKLEKN